MNFKIFAFLFCAPFLLLPQECNSAKILFTFFHDSGSHFGSMRPMMEKLAQRGHSVAFLDTIFTEDISPSIRHIRANIPRREDAESRQKFAHILWHSRLYSHSLIEYYRIMDGHFGTLLANYTEKIVEIMDEQWDFIVIDDLFWSFGFALTTKKHQIWELKGSGNEPKIILYSTAAQGLPSAASTRSLGRNWVSRVPLLPFVPTNSKDIYSPNKFVHRIYAFYEALSEFIFLNTVTISRMPNIHNFGVPKFTWFELYKRILLEFSDSVDRIGWPLAVGNEIINVGANCKSGKRMPKKFAEFIEAPNSKGTIYLAFGTHADWSLSPRHVRDALFGAFGRLGEFRIIFVYNGPAPAKLAKNVLLTKWAPQLEILAHPKTRAFISHGGNKSIREALCVGVPLIVMPIYAEQAHSAHLLVAMGISPVLNKFTLTEEGVFGTISQVLSEPGSGARARKLQSMFVDRSMPALEEGVFRVERLAGKGGRRWRQFTQRRGTRLDWPQFAYFHHILVLAAFCAFLSWK